MDIFHSKFSTENDARRIAGVYDDEEMCGTLPREDQTKWLSYHRFFAERVQEDSAKKGADDRWALNRLLAVAFSSDLHSEKLSDDPFEPWPSGMLLNGMEEPLSPSGLEKNELLTLAMVLNATHDSFMRQRLADILWTYRKKWTNRSEAVRYAELALEEYMRTPVSIISWWSYGARKKWWRAAKIAQMLNRGGEKAKNVVKVLLYPLRGKKPRAVELASEIADLLMAAKLPVEKETDDADNLEKALRQGLKREMAEGNDGWVIGFHKSLEKWHNNLKIVGSLDEVHRTVGDYFAEKAESFFLNGVKAHDRRGVEWTQAARKAYEKMTKGAKEKAGVTVRVEKLRLMQESFLKAAENGFARREIQMEGAGLKKADFREEIKGKTAMEAVLLFLFGLGEPNLNEFRRRAQDPVSCSFVRQMMTTVFQQDGRVVGKVPPLERTGDESDELRIDAADEVLQYCGEVTVRERKVLIPAFECLRESVSLTLADFVWMCRESSWVAENHWKLTAKGLFYGWQGDFWTAVSLLCPQVEASVRMRMKKAGLLTTHLKDELDHETGLSKLLNNPEIDKAIPDKLERFELMALFSGGDKGGFNFRNDLGHGLLSDQAIESNGLMYAWWFIWRQVIRAQIQTPEGD